MMNTDLLNSAGYALLSKMTQADYELIMVLVDHHYKDILAKNKVPLSEAAHVTEHMRFDKFASDNSLWTKRNRLLSKPATLRFQSISLFDELKALMGPFTISDEEDLGYSNIYFRLVRPSEPADVGPPHADSWFWEIANQSANKRFKVWIPLWPLEGEPSFKFIPGSHKKKNLYSYKTVNKSGLLKPEITNQIPNDKFFYHGAVAGVPILFHDDLIHGGQVTNRSLRISIEFTGLQHS
jgi:hypothetical protein